MDTNSLDPAPPSVLVVDSDERSLRLLEVGLRQAGYRVISATSSSEALSQCESEPPMVALIDVDLADGDGFALAGRLRVEPGCESILMLFLCDPRRPSDRIRAYEVGASDVLDKPVYLKEALWRVETLLEKAAQRGTMGTNPAQSEQYHGAARFYGTLSGTTLLDLLQSMEMARKTGLTHCQNARGQRGILYFSDGKVIDAEVGPLRGAEALYRMLTWRDGEYRVDLLDVVRPDRIGLPTSELLFEGARRLDAWNQLLNGLPPLDTVLLASLGDDAPTAVLHLETLSAEFQDVLASFNGQRTIQDVVEMDEELPLDALGRLSAVSKLLSARLLVSRLPVGATRSPRMTPAPLPRLTPSPAPRLTPPPLARLTPSPLPRLTPSPLPRLTPSPLPRLTPAPAPRLTPPPMPRLTPPPMPTARLTPPPMPQMTASALQPHMTPAMLHASAPRSTPHGVAAAAVAPRLQPTIEHQYPSAPPSVTLPELSAELLPADAGMSATGSLPELSADLLSSDASGTGLRPVSLGTNSAADRPLPRPQLRAPAEWSANSTSALRIGASSDPGARSGYGLTPISGLSSASSSSRAVPVRQPSQIWRHVITGVVGIGLFGLGMGLFWAWQALTRPADVAVAPVAIPPPAVVAPSVAQSATGLAPVAALPPVAPPPAAVAPPPVAAAPSRAAPAAVAPPAPTVAPLAAVAASPPLTPQQKDAYDALIAKARHALQRNQTSQAHHFLREAIKLQPQGVPGLVVQAEVAIDEGDADSAGRLAKKALQLDPNYPDAHLMLGMSAQARAQVGIAHIHFKKYLELAPQGEHAQDVKAILRSGY